MAKDDTTLKATDRDQLKAATIEIWRKASEALSGRVPKFGFRPAKDKQNG